MKITSELNFNHKIYWDLSQSCQDSKKKVNFFEIYLSNFKLLQILIKIFSKMLSNFASLLQINQINFNVLIVKN